MISPLQSPQFGTWSVPNCQLIVEYDFDVLETIRRQVTTSFEPIHRGFEGGIEIAGLLLGSYNGDSIRITGFEPVRCEHAFGPAFILSQDDTDELSQQLRTHEASADSGGEMLVGWYQSHVRRGLALSPEEIEIYNRYFPKPWQVALLLRPAPGGSVQARFFLREASGTGPKPPFVRFPVVNSNETALTMRSDASSRGIQNKAVWLMLAAMFVLTVASVFYLRIHFALVAPPPGILPVEAGIRGGGIEVRWDPKRLGDPKRGRLEVRSGSVVQQVTLDREMLVYGRFICWPKSDVTSFRLHVDRSDGAPLEGSTTYVARSVPIATSAVEPAGQIVEPARQTQSAAKVTASPATPAQIQLAGRWVLDSVRLSRSTAVPKSVDITVNDAKGSVHGTLDAHYKSRLKSGHVHFSFYGKVMNDIARFSWTSTHGHRGQIEFIALSNSPDRVEVVWKNPESKQVFDEMLRRVANQ